MTATAQDAPAALGPAAARSWHPGSDPVGFLTFCSVALLVFPATQRVGALRALGASAVLLGVLLLGYWLYGVVTRKRWAAPSPWLALIVGFYLASVVASYIAGMTREDLDGTELSTADIALVTAFASAGFAIMAGVSLVTRDRMEFLLKGLVSGGGIIASLAILQFVFGIDFLSDLSIPGFSNFVSAWDPERSGFIRVQVTTSHPIEFSVVLAMLLPLALHVALYRNHSRTAWWWFCVAVIGLALPMTVSRTGVVALAAIAITLVPTWPARRIVNAAVIGLLGIVALRLMVPGLVGTLRSLIFDAGQDPSISARTSDYAEIERYISERPVFGRGYGTFIPTKYLFLDNEWLMTLIVGGVVGLVALMGLFVGALVLARIARELTVEPVERDLAQCLAASILVAMITCLTYDAFSFGTGRCLTFLVIGMTAALYQTARAARVRRATSSPRLSSRVRPDLG